MNAELMKAICFFAANFLLILQLTGQTATLRGTVTDQTGAIITGAFRQSRQTWRQIARPAAGPNGGSIYIDGFRCGELPPKTRFARLPEFPHERHLMVVSYAFHSSSS